MQTVLRADAHRRPMSRLYRFDVSLGDDTVALREVLTVAAILLLAFATRALIG